MSPRPTRRKKNNRDQRKVNRDQRKDNGDTGAAKEELTSTGVTQKFNRDRSGRTKVNRDQRNRRTVNS